MVLRIVEYLSAQGWVWRKSQNQREKKTQTSLSKWLVQYGTKGTFSSFCCKDLDVTLSTVVSCFMSVFYSTTQFVQSKRETVITLSGTRTLLASLCISSKCITIARYWHNRMASEADWHIFFFFLLFFLSTELVDELCTETMNFCGTVKPNRKAMAKSIGHNTKMMLGDTD